MIPYSRFPKQYQRNLQFFRCASSPEKQNEFNYYEIPKHVFHFVELCWGVLVSPKLKIIGFGSHGRVQKSEDHENEGGVFPKVKWTSY